MVGNKFRSDVLWWATSFGRICAMVGNKFWQHVLWWATLQPSVASCPWTENKLTRKLCLQVDNGTLNNEFRLAIQLLLAYIDDDEYANHFL